MSSIVGPTIRLSGPIEWDNIVNGDGLRAVILDARLFQPL